MYRAGFAADSQMKLKYKEEHPGSTDEDLAKYLLDTDYVSHALGNVKNYLSTIVTRFNDDYKLYVHKQGNFRYDLATIRPYKGNRDRNHVPKYKDEITEYMLSTWGAIPVVGIESDDAICLEQHKHPDKSTVIVSIDKDIINGMYGWSYNPSKDELKFTSPKEANNFFFWQMLVGDSSDNIPGIDGIGPKKATALLEKVNYDNSLFKEEVKTLYKRQYGEGWEAAYKEVGNLLYILRRPEDLNNGCPLL